MTRLAALICLFALPAVAADNHVTATVLDTATKVTGSLVNTSQYKTILVENGGSAAVYCAPTADVTTNTGNKVGANDGFRSFPYDGPIWCIAAASQSGTGRDHVIVWGSYQ